MALKPLMAGMSQDTSGGSSSGTAPSGGSAGTALIKNSGADYDYSWSDLVLAHLSGLGSNVATFLATPSSANFAAAVTGETGTGGVVFSDSPLLTTLLTIDRNTIGTTTANGFVLENTTAAANGAQQNSPALAIIGTGWATGAGASSPCQARFEAVPTQGSSAPTFKLFLRTKIGASSELSNFKFGGDGVAEFSANVASSSSTTGTVIITGGLGVSAASNFGSTLGITGAVSSSSNFTAGTTNGFIGQGSSSLYVNGTAGLWIFDTSGFAGNAALLCLGTATNSSPCIGRELINSIRLQSAARTDTWNDISTANSGTAANRYCLGINAPTFTSTGTSVTDTVGSTFYIGGAPTASTNTTIGGTPWALNVNAGSSNFGGPAVLPRYTVAGLPSTAATGKTQGALVCITDALAPTFGATLVGGGAIVCLGLYDNTNWTAR